MEKIIQKTKIVRIKSELEGLDGNCKEIPIAITEDGAPRAVAFFDIDQTLAELKEIHGKAIKILFKGIHSVNSIEWTASIIWEERNG